MGAMKFLIVRLQFLVEEKANWRVTRICYRELDFLGAQAASLHLR